MNSIFDKTAPPFVISCLLPIKYTEQSWSLKDTVVYQE